VPLRVVVDDDEFARHESSLAGLGNQTSSDPSLDVQLVHVQGSRC
jgi:hypothetical protein